MHEGIFEKWVFNVIWHEEVHGTHVCLPAFFTLIKIDGILYLPIVNLLLKNVRHHCQLGLAPDCADHLLLLQIHWLINEMRTLVDYKVLHLGNVVVESRDDHILQHCVPQLLILKGIYSQ